MAIQIQNDEPTTIDTLDRGRFAQSLARVIETCDTPLVVGLYGTWGIGKTSLMRQIEYELGANTKIRTIWFDPWQHQFDEDPAIALLHTMVEQLKLGDTAKKLLTVIAAALGSILLKATTTLSTTEIQELGERYEQERFQIREKQIRLREYFTKLIGRASESGYYRLVFFIDDLDRCVPEQVLKVLEALKLYLNLPNCVYVIGVDRSALECSIRHKYKEQEVREADYLDKIVQLPFTIPPIARESMSRFIAPLLPDGLADSHELLVLGLGDNPRQVKRFVNTLLLNHELASAMMGEHYDPKLLAGVLLVQYRQQDMYRAAVLDPAVLTAAASDGDAVKPFEEQLKKDPRLAEVINKAGFKDPQSIAPYIYLSEVASVRQINFNVFLSHIGTNKINVIKTVRELTALGLKDAKDLVESAPVVVMSGLERPLAEEYVRRLREAGATADVR
ncbi:MAG TPA: ribosomal protein L7/L12 [Pyrinomonadaceae bacterium]|nr:ribosomal protein L7/L12 [Pyrinomonadaceae bacterium]